MSAFTPEQETRVREIVEEALAARDKAAAERSQRAWAPRVSEERSLD